MDIDWRRIFRIRDDYGRINALFLAVVGLLAVIILIVVVSLTAINQQNRQYDKNMTYVDNVSTYASYMDFAAREEMYMALNSALRENGVKNPPYFGGLIREGTYEQTTLDTDRYASEFIVDVAEVQQSYQVYLVWNGFNNVDMPDNLVILRCPAPDQMIYEDFNCQNPPILTLEAATRAENYLPYTEYNDEGVATFSIRMQRGNQKETIFLNLWTCGDENLAKDYEKQARAWFKDKTKIDLEQYNLSISNVCAGSDLES